ncbi:hypothetical protein L195_g024982 [Trifolium pratense]|uniref:Uncharacterized protein n=1 Tax=Trifolium pratense TaxID=57577 RepID=A0A2K3NF74_TRIPR|nr:hypothetical protein L195_g024982 [Trifolium pratense]
MSNVFQHYGDIVEVVIPARRDKRGERFGFARFVKVDDIRRFEYELDEIIIGRDKISVNISRFQRQERQNDRREGENNDAENRRERQKRDGDTIHNSDELRGGLNSYAQAVSKGARLNNTPIHVNQGLRKVSYRAAVEDLQSLKKALVGTVVQPGMSYNIQEEFHMQGYFGIKITPLGANMVLMEEQEEGELQALQDDAKDWLAQWFCLIKPWEPGCVDNERVMWVRVYGIPAHAWHVDFFELICKAYGFFINADDGTMKKNTMDVARLMLRTKRHKVVDDVFEAIINGETFSLRIIEDSYGPMRILIPPKINNDGRDDVVDSSDEEDDVLGFDETARSCDDHHDHVEDEREFVDESAHPIVIFESPNSNMERGIDERYVIEGVQVEENISHSPFKELSNNAEPCLSIEGNGASKNGPSSNSSASTNNLCCNGERDVSNASKNIDAVGRSVPKLLLKNNSQLSGQRGGDQSNLLGTRIVEKQHTDPCQIRTTLNGKVGVGRSSNNSKLGKSVSISNGVSTQALPQPCSRNPVGRCKKPKLAANSLSSAGGILCCSSLHSSDIRNCNSRIQNNRDKEVTSKVWKGAKDLGVGGIAVEEVCISHIHNNEKRDKEGRIQREQLKKVPK